jgi:cytochrome c556
MRPILVLAVASIGLWCGPPARAASQPAVEYRQHLMKTLEAQFQAITLIYIAGAPAENLHSHLTAALLTARMMPAAFELRVQGGASQPTIWTNWDDYARRMREFEARIAIAVEASKHGTPPQDVLFHIDAISCKECHDRYRRY